MEQGEGRERGAAEPSRSSPTGAAESSRPAPSTTASEAKRRLTTEVSEASLQLISRLQREWGLRSRGAVIDRLMAELQPPGQDPDSFSDHGLGAAEPGHAPRSQASADPLSSSGPVVAVDTAAERALAESRRQPQQAFAGPAASGPVSRAEPAAAAVEPVTSAAGFESGLSGAMDRFGSPAPELEEEEPELAPLFSETGALVLVQREGSLEASLEFVEEERPRLRRRGRSSGIDLPGFVRRNTAQLRRSLHPPARQAAHHGDVLPALADPDLIQALETASEHWFSLYGQPANEAVIEASMIWLAQDIWTQSDQSEGEAFTWTLAQHLIAPCAPSWPEGPPTLERVIVLAGLLEDPFSAATLSLRIPTLIRRFVHKFRRRRQGASFQTLEHTMTLHGALKLLQIPLDSGQRLTLPLIREAYREMAMNHHPDAGGSVEMMRRLNEAYQLLKELYRNKENGAERPS